MKGYWDFRFSILDFRFQMTKRPKGLRGRRAEGPEGRGAGGPGNVTERGGVDLGGLFVYVFWSDSPPLHIVCLPCCAVHKWRVARVFEQYDVGANSAFGLRIG